MNTPKELLRHVLALLGCGPGDVRVHFVGGTRFLPYAKDLVTHFGLTLASQTTFHICCLYGRDVRDKTVPASDQQTGSTLRTAFMSLANTLGQRNPMRKARAEAFIEAAGQLGSDPSAEAVVRAWDDYMPISQHVSGDGWGTFEEEQRATPAPANAVYSAGHAKAGQPLPHMWAFLWQQFGLEFGAKGGK